MKSLPSVPLVLALCVVLGGCLATPVDKSGSVTSTNTNPSALVSAAQTVFANYGYTPGPGSFPDYISFQKPAGTFGKIMYGSYGTTTTIRVRMTMVQIPGTNNYRLGAKVSRVSDAGEAGFEDSTKMMGMWAGQFDPILKQVASQASGAGQGY